MDELEVLIAILVGLYKLIRWIVVGILRTLWGIVRFFLRAQQGHVGPAQSRNKPELTRIATTPAVGAGPIARELQERFDEIARAADDEAAATLRDGSATNDRFAPSLESLAKAAREQSRRAATASDGKTLGKLFGEAEYLAFWLQILRGLTAERRDRRVSALLGDADALAEKLYEPIIEYCKNREIKLTTDFRVATVIGGDGDMYMGLDDPSGLAVVVLPAEWGVQIGWWPALAHEIGHDFYNSVIGLAGELRRRLRVPARAMLPSVRITVGDIDGAVGAWQEELFADAFGTMMLGPAYVMTMFWSFSAEDRPSRALEVNITDEGAIEAHPPGHVRVAAACRLLAAMGYGAQADRLELSWRRAHREPTQIFFPTRAGTWGAVNDEAVIARAAQVGLMLYQSGFDALAGVPLRSIPGLDFGPREHELAHDVKAALLARRRVELRDPRLVMAGCVVAWAEKPEQAAMVMTTARRLIVGIGERRPADENYLDDANVSPADGDLWRDAVMLQAILQPRVIRRTSSRR